MRPLMRLAVVVVLLLSASVILAQDRVEVISRGANPNQTGVEIRVRMSNSIELNGVSVPLVFRELTPGSFITSLKMDYTERLPTGIGSPLTGVVIRHQLADEDGNCKSGLPGGFGTITYTDGGPNPVGSSPECAFFARQRITDATLPPGSDSVGSMILTVDVTGPEGSFEIDTTCVDPTNHLFFLKSNPVGQGVVPAFTKGTITIASGNPPVAVCKDTALQAVSACYASIAAVSLDDGSFDPEGQPLTFELIPPGPYAVGVHSVLFVASDGVFLDTCVSQIAVLDSVPPTIVCPSNITKENDPGLCGATTTFHVSASDNCSGVAVSVDHSSGSFFPIGTTTVTAVAADPSGNADTCSFDITVNDRSMALFEFDHDTLEFTTIKQGPTPDPQTLTVTNVGRCGDIDFEVIELVQWVSGSPDTSVTPGTIEFGITTTDLTPGVYWGEVMIMEIAPSGTLAGKTLWVKYTVEAPPANSVTVGSRTALAGSDITVQVLLANEVPLQEIDIPLVFREIDAGAYVTSVQMLGAERLPEGAGQPLTGSVVKATFPTDDGSCISGTGVGFGTEGTLDYTSPDAIHFQRARLVSDPPLYPGADVTGSLLLKVGVTSTPGSFEIDTTCVDPNAHLLFVEDGTGTPIVPTFTKGVITISETCDCPHQSDLDESGFLDAEDLNAMIDVLFFGAFDPQDPLCPATRSDFDCSGYADALDLNDLIDHLFFNGSGPCDQCSP